MVTAESEGTAGCFEVALVKKAVRISGPGRRKTEART